MAIKYRKWVALVFALTLVASLTVGCGSRAEEFGLVEDELEAAATATLSIKVRGSSSGRSIEYLGANGGDSIRSIRDIRDLGLTTYRLFGGMERFEPVDDDGRFGSPTIADMKRVLSSSPSRVNDFVNWTAFDRRMSSYGQQLRELYNVPGMEPIMVLRNSANWGNTWLPKMSVSYNSCKTSSGQLITWPQFTQADWNEWWQHVFAVVYWINVRNGSSMRVDRWTAHNEPNQGPNQGWCGTKEQYREFVKYTNDAIDFVYKTYLRDRSRTVYGGNVSMRPGWEDWLRPLLRSGTGTSFTERSYYQPSMFDAIAINPYNNDISKRVATARQLTQESFTASYTRSYPIWANEMGSYRNGQWDNIPRIVEYLVGNLIGVSTPGAGRAQGALVWRMYDGNSDTAGLVKKDGTRRPGYYAMRLAVTALNGGKPVYPTQFSGAATVKAVTTRESAGVYTMLLSNTAATTAYDVRADVAELLASGTVELYLFNGSRKGANSLERLSSSRFSSGQLRFNLPPHSVVLVRFRS